MERLSAQEHIEKCYTLINEHDSALEYFSSTNFILAEGASVVMKGKFTGKASNYHTQSGEPVKLYEFKHEDDDVWWVYLGKEALNAMEPVVRECLTKWFMSLFQGSAILYTEIQLQKIAEKTAVITGIKTYSELQFLVNNEWGDDVVASFSGKHHRLHAGQNNIAAVGPSFIEIRIRNTRGKSWEVLGNWSIKVQIDISQAGKHLVKVPNTSGYEPRNKEWIYFPYPFI